MYSTVQYFASQPLAPTIQYLVNALVRVYERCIACELRVTTPYSVLFGSHYEALVHLRRGARSLKSKRNVYYTTWLSGRVWEALQQLKHLKQLFSRRACLSIRVNSTLHGVRTRELEGRGRGRWDGRGLILRTSFHDPCLAYSTPNASECINWFAACSRPHSYSTVHSVRDKE